LLASFREAVPDPAEEVAVPTRTVRGISLVMGFLALLVGLYVIGKRENRFRAEAAVAITPVATANPAAAVGGLAGGDVVSTFAEAFAGSEVVRPALLSTEIEGPDIQATDIAAELVPNSTVISVTATAPSREVAETAATAVASWKPDLRGLSDLYEPHLVRSAAGTGERTGTSTTVLRLEVLIVAVLVGLLTAAAVRRIPQAEPAPAASAGKGSGGSG
jgi:hypothetical protein